MPESLSQSRIADQYTSLLHVSGASIASWPKNTTAKVYDGAGNVTGLSLSSTGDRFIINNYIEPVGWPYQKEWIDAFFPINVVILTTEYKNPGDRMPGTKWICQDSQGLFAVGAGTGTDKNNNTFTFTAGKGGVANGDRAGEFRATLDVEDVPPHSHTTDLHLETIPANENGQGTNVNFIFYFGATLNPDQLQREDGRLLDDDAIEAFQYNTTYNDIENYRDHIIKQRSDVGNGYTDADFDPRFGGYPLQGWAPPQAGGPGWGGILNTSGRFMGNSPRPIDVKWKIDGITYSISRSITDPRSSDRVHPGRFSDRELIKARDFIIHVLGRDKAILALDGVNRLKEINATVEEATAGDNTYYSRIPGNRVVKTSTTGEYVRHNNIPPNFPIYFWQRVPLDYVDELPPIDRPGVNLPMQFTITSNQKSTKNNEFNLNKWAVDQGWNGQAACTIIIDKGVYIYSDDRYDQKVPAMIIDEFPQGLTLINKGFIMGRGGNGGSLQTNGQDGGDAIRVIGNSEIVIDNTDGAIAGGGGGGSASKDGESGGGGGAGGGWGGTAAVYQLPGWDFGDGDGSLQDFWRSTAAGGAGGDPGQPGGHGRWYNNFQSLYSLQLFKATGDVVTVGWGPAVPLLPGVGGEAGGSGAWGRSRNGVDDQGSGGGGGRVLSPTAYGGGSGGVPGAEFGALDVSGNLRTTGPAWSNTAPANNGSVNVLIIPRPNRSRDRIIETYVTAYNSSQPYRGWNSGYKLRQTRGYGNGQHWAVGPHWRANGVNNGTTGIPYIIAGVNKPGRGSHREFGVTDSLNYNGFSYLSPTGWDGYNHRSALVRGGSGNQPGVYTTAPVRRIGREDLFSGDYTEEVGAGGGGWGAPGGQAWGANNIRKPGRGGFSIRVSRGKVKIMGGIVYGESEGNVNIG
jgi:hypothetical protein